MQGIDVSRHQGNIDWQKVKNAGIEFAIIKAGGSDDGFYTDSCYEQNYANAKAVGIPVGAYYYVGPKCLGYESGKADAERFINMLAGKQFEYPVYIDVEEQPQGMHREVTDAIKGFCETMEAAGFYVGIYGSDYSSFKDRFFKDEVTQWCWWVAHYDGEIDYATNWGIWQYTSRGDCPGIYSEGLDMDECRVDYVTTIKNGGFNGWGTPQVAPQPVAEPVQGTIFKEGDVVSFNAIYVSSTSTEALTPAVTSGTITKVIPGAHNPYLINDGTGWVNDACIITGNSSNPSASFVVGSNIRIQNGAIDLNNGKKYAEFVYKKVYVVMEISENRVVFGDGVKVTGATDINNCILA